jgi:aryl-alcohol dehydrogenase-like predicted oxidoreductase
VTLPRRPLADRTVSVLGLGGARWSLVDRPDDVAITRTVGAALEAGITLFDTARAYTPPGVDAYGERTLAAALREHSAGAEVVVLTKGGHERLADGSFVVDARPEVLRAHCVDALTSLGRDRLDGFLLHWPDPEVPLAESVGALDELRRDGLTHLIGVCNVDLGQLEGAHAVAPIDVVQNPCSALGEGDDEVAAFCRAQGIDQLGYSPLGGTRGAAVLARGAPGLAGLTERYAASVPELVLAHLLHTRPDVVPLVGAGRPETVRSVARAGTLELDPDDLRRIEEVLGASTIGQHHG